MVEVIKATDIENEVEWKEFLRNQYNLFFDFRFNSYNDHFDKKIKWHHLKFKSKDPDKVVAIMIGCEKIIDGKLTYVSCDGVSFGGFLWKKKIDLISYFDIIKSFKEYLLKNKFQNCILKNPPFLYNKIPGEETEYALVKSGFSITNDSITNIIDLEDFEFKKISETKKRSIKKSSGNIKVKILNHNLDRENFKEYYTILLENRELKNVNPTHSCEELMYLKNHLGDDIILFAAYVDSKLVAICVLFSINKEIILNFYLAGDDKYKMEGVSEYILFKTIEWSKENGYKYYDIGTSDNDGRLIEGLFAFKKKFLAHGFLRKTFELNLSEFENTK
jgi:lipid II:glycine glycyltransferase (peptidoglycan interpeptide bridge formation enzyme)